MHPAYVALLCLLELCGARSPHRHQDDSDHILCSANSRQIVNNGNGSTIWPWQTYKSSNATPPALQINRTNESLSDGLLFLAPSDGSSIPGTKEQAPIIMRDDGELVWNGPVHDSSNLLVQTLDGKQVLTYWSGQGSAGYSLAIGHGFGQVVVLDSTYTVIHTVCPQLNLTLPPGATARCVADVHESKITDRNTMLITAYNTTPHDLSSIGGPTNGWLLDSLALEVDIVTGKVLFSWSPLAYLQLNRTLFPLSGAAGTSQSAPFDAFHVNSIQLVGNNYLINIRNVWATFLVSPTGKIIWEINGLDGGDFGALPEGGTFSWQHDARLETLNSSAALIHWFANNNDEFTAPSDIKPSTGLTFLITLPPDPSSPPVLYTNYTNPQNPVGSWSQGSFQYLPNGSALMGYGAYAVIEEFGPKRRTSTSDDTQKKGHVRWSAAFGSGDLVSSYRVFKQEWHATPATKPSLTVSRAAANDTLNHCAGRNSTWRGYVSWNGATDVTRWLVYAGTSNANANANATLKAVGSVRKEGFETEFVVPQGAAFVQVGAVENESHRDAVRWSDVVAIPA
ncbi:hypothetical protein H2202_001964 [Exophiala xenobiotica]|nr:hypothetical protein H2202_001964 [Exophiala xenobiotica]KAK5197839.1 hypothetical protein LTR92_002084 [Exophiala xenobiotica]KAK5238323.1 hypothetical protein LTR47_000066 [Exophiala xenobiotica]KAK5252695.1 hypothetical protein LTS06_002872 [Exophiala xenobiotica]KAK5349951.1 hypothetical protein LTR61_006657 [Exophiala xenobiotica]